MKKFYVYIYRHPITNEEIYIGKGKDGRLYEHLYRAYNVSKRRRSYFLNKLIQIFNETGKKAIVEIHTNDLSEDEALKLEILLISKYGRKGLDENGILYNRTLGGDGISGYKWTEDQKKKLSENRKSKNLQMSQKTREALLKANLGRKMPKSAIDSTREKKSKEWIVINPQKKQIKIKNLAQFCTDNKLLSSSLRKTLETKKPVSRGPNTGWMLINQDFSKTIV